MYNWLMHLKLSARHPKKGATDWSNLNKFRPEFVREPKKKSFEKRIHCLWCAKCEFELNLCGQHGCADERLLQATVHCIGVCMAAEHSEQAVNTHQN